MELSAITPAGEADAVTPADGTNIAPTRGIYVGASGDLKVDMLDGSTLTFVSITAGVVHPLQVVRVYSTGTTATDIIALR
jgi:hypothetical protein